MRWLTTVLVLFTVATAALAEEERLVGWQGETHRVEDSSEPWIEQLSWSPRAYLYRGFLTKAECEHLMSEATPLLEKSSVVDNDSGKSVDSDIRTSSGMFFRRGQDDVIARVEERIAAFAMVPVDHGEGIQVLRYAVGQRYEAHFDYFHDTVNTQNGGQRVATVLLYLSDVEEGGETTFPSAAANKQDADNLSACGRKGLAVKPTQGSALLFWSLSLDGNMDPSSLHASCPVVRGTKWTATKWMRVGRVTGV